MLLTKDFLDERLVPELEGGTVQYFDHMRRYLFAQQYVANKRVLDLACGTGYGSELITRGGAQRVIAFDIDPAALHYAKKHWHRKAPTIHFGQADASKIPLPSQSVDILVSFETIEHLPAPQLFLTEVKRLLVPNGKFIVSTPNRSVSSPGSTTPFSPYHSFEPNLAEFLALFESVGWHLDAIQGIQHSRRAMALIRPTSAAFSRQPTHCLGGLYP